MTDKFINRELIETLEKREKRISSKIITVAAGTTSSGLGDERNLREFLLADNIVKYFREDSCHLFLKYSSKIFFAIGTATFDPSPLASPELIINKTTLLVFAIISSRL